MSSFRTSVLGMVFFCFSLPAFAAAERPNFVFIIGDDISSADLGCFGNPGIRTPNLDRLAGMSRVFDNAYVTTSSCSPSRCSILTSRYPHNLESAAELHGELPPGTSLFPKVLRDAGYFAAHAGKTHFGVMGPQITGPAKDAFAESSGGATDELQAGDGGENQWIETLRRRPRDRPFFMWLASHDGHRPWGPNSFSGINRPADVTVPPFLVDTPETRDDLAHYYDEVTRLDYHVGEVLRELARQGVLEQTVVIFLSDNGRPFPHSKTRLFDDGIKTPLMIRMPGAADQAGRTPALASSIDLAPTILELAGLESPPSFQGVSLTPILRDPTAKVRDYIFAEQNWHNFPAHVRMIRGGNFVYVRNAWPQLPLPGASDTFYENPSAAALKEGWANGRLTAAQRDAFTQPRPAEEFYDLSRDPHKIVNLTGTGRAPPPEFEVLRAIEARWEEETGDTVQINPTPADIDYLTGRKLDGFRRGTPPGAASHALGINRPGPVRETATAGSDARGANAVELRSEAKPTRKP